MAVTAIQCRSDTQVIQYTGGSPESLHTTARISNQYGTPYIGRTHARTIARRNTRRRRTHANGDVRTRIWTSHNIIVCGHRAQTSHNIIVWRPSAQRRSIVRVATASTPRSEPGGSRVGGKKCCPRYSDVRFCT